MEAMKSEAYKKAEAKMAAVLFIVFAIWCPVYIFGIRPIINSALVGHISGYPAMLHLIPIFLPIVVFAVIFGRALPPKN